MPGFGDTTFIVLLALLLFGPKKLPGLARQLGKLMAEFRRASNEFRTQMEEELRISEQAERQKQVAAIEAAAAKPALPIPEPEHPYLPPPMDANVGSPEPDAAPHIESAASNDLEAADDLGQAKYLDRTADLDRTGDADLGRTGEWDRTINPDLTEESQQAQHPELTIARPQEPRPEIVPVQPVPIATSGSLNLMPPSTGLPVANTSSARSQPPAPPETPPEASVNRQEAPAQAVSDSQAAPDSEAVHG